MTVKTVSWVYSTIGWTAIQNAFTTAGWTLSNIVTSWTNYCSFKALSSGTIDWESIKYFIKLPWTSTSYYWECKSYDSDWTTLKAQRTNIIKGWAYASSLYAIVWPDYFLIAGTWLYSSQQYCGYMIWGNTVDFVDALWFSWTDNLFVVAGLYSSGFTANPYSNKATTKDKDWNTVTNDWPSVTNCGSKYSYPAQMWAWKQQLSDMFIKMSNDTTGICGTFKRSLFNKSTIPYWEANGINLIDIDWTTNLYVKYGYSGSLILPFEDVA
jgi:hypothetical protein